MATSSGLPLTLLEHGLEDERGADRGDGERGGEPSAHSVLGTSRVRARSEREARRRSEHREEQEAGVGRRRDRRRLEVVEDGRVVEVAERPREHADADQQPRASLAPRLPGAAEAQHAREHLDDVVRVVAEERARAQARGRR